MDSLKYKIAYDNPTNSVHGEISGALVVRINKYFGDKTCDVNSGHAFCDGLSEELRELKMKALDMKLVYNSRSQVQDQFDEFIHYSLHVKIRNYFDDSKIYDADEEFSVMDKIREMFGVSEY